MLLFISFLLSFQSFAIEGTFHYSGEFKVISASRHESVDISTIEGQERIIALRLDKYDCSAANPAICTKQIISDRSDSQLAQFKPPVNTIVFGPLNSISKINQTNSLTTIVYTADQSLAFDREVYDRVKYYESENRIRASIDIPFAPISLMINKESVGHVSQLVVNESSNALIYYIIESNYSK